MATLEEITNDVRVYLNREDLFQLIPDEGEINIRVIYTAINTVIKNLSLEQGFRVYEKIHAIEAVREASVNLPPDFQRFLYAYWTDAQGNVNPPKIPIYPHDIALTKSTSRSGYRSSFCACSIFGNKMYFFPEPDASSEGGVKVFYVAEVPKLVNADDSNYFTEKFDGYIIEAATVYVIKSIPQARSDDQVVYDIERTARMLKETILLEEKLSKGSST